MNKTKHGLQFHYIYFFHHLKANVLKGGQFAFTFYPYNKKKW